jgi:hypothetical protein
MLGLALQAGRHQRRSCSGGALSPYERVAQAGRITLQQRTKKTPNAQRRTSNIESSRSQTLFGNDNVPATLLPHRRNGVSKASAFPNGFWERGKTRSITGPAESRQRRNCSDGALSPSECVASKAGRITAIEAPSLQSSGEGIAAGKLGAVPYRSSCSGHSD